MAFCGWVSRSTAEERRWRIGYAGAPFGAVRAGYGDGSGTAEVQVTNPSGGKLGGDELRMEVFLAPGSSATVLTGWRTRLTEVPKPVRIPYFEVGDRAVLEYLPHHLIPYASSNYRQTTEVASRGARPS